VQALQSLADNKCRHLKSIIYLHVIFITYVFTIIYKRGAGSQIDTSSIKKKKTIYPSISIFFSLCAAGLSSAPPAVWAFWRLIWRTESLDRGLILIAGFPLSAVGSAFQFSDPLLFIRLDARA
jgi:hypothetical protein